MLEPAREWSHPSLRAGRDDAHSVVCEERRNLGCVSTELVKATSKRCPLLARNLQLKNAQRKSVDEQNDVGASGALISFDRVLVDGEELVPLWVFKVNEPDDVVPGLTTVVPPLNRDSCCQELVDSPVLCKHISTLGSADGCNHLIEDGGESEGFRLPMAARSRSSRRTSR